MKDFANCKNKMEVWKDGHTYHLLYSVNTLGDLKDEKKLKGLISDLKFDTVKKTGSTFV